MFTQMRLMNFKSWKETGDIELRPITAVFGTNSSGKSSLLHALLLLKQTADSTNRNLVFDFGNEDTPCNLGNFADVVFGHDCEKIVEISVDWRQEKLFEIRDPLARGRLLDRSKDLGFTVVAKQEGDDALNDTMIAEMSYGVGRSRFGMRRTNEEYRLVGTMPKKPAFRFIETGRGFLPIKLGPEKCFGFPDVVRSYYKNAGFVMDLPLALKQRLDTVYHLGPLRAAPVRRYPWSGTPPDGVGRVGEAVVEAMLAARKRGQMISPGHRKRRIGLEQYVAMWLEKLELVDQFSVHEVSEGTQIYEVRIRRTAKAEEVTLTDVGFGISQILPVLVLCLFVPEGATVLLEQPEIHLHPAVQSGLADFLIDVCKNRKVQVIVESHSEHLLRRLQRRIAEEVIEPEDVGLYFCALRDDRSELSRLDINSVGSITNWPDDFFGDEFEEMAATMRAAQKRLRGSER